MKSTRVVLAIGSMAIGLIGCGDRDIQTDLEPEGPPVIKQALMQGRVMLETGSRIINYQMVYGAHPEINDSTSVSEHNAYDNGLPVTGALPRANRLRVVFDELMVGNNIEEIACASCLDVPTAQCLGNGTVFHDRVPRGTTPDDIADCAGPVEIIQSTCVGDHAVCIGVDGPVGILDSYPEGGDGAIDDVRMIEDVLTVTCADAEVVWDRERSFYQPAGNQLISAGPLGINSLGPAIIVDLSNPDDALLSGMRTSADCTLTFAAEVVDKDDIAPCAPLDGDDCTPGELPGLAWTVEALRVNGQAPAANAVNVALTTTNDTFPNSGLVQMQFNANLDAASIAGVTIADENGTIPTCADPPVGQCVVVARNTSDATLLQIFVIGGFTPLNLHTVTVPTGLTDVFGGPLPAEISFSFTTRDATPQPDAGVDADPADASTDAPIDA